MPADVLIKNGLIIDGSGQKAYQGNVLIEHGKVASLGKVHGSAERVIDADGLAVAPGFWDVHTHYDAQFLWDPIATSSSWHGVTTVVMGNCGFTVAPCRREDQDWLVKMLARVEGMDRNVLQHTLPWEWETFGQYLDALEKRGIGINTAVLAGHSAIRRYVMGVEASERAATEHEVARMKEVLKQCLEAGAIGLSSSRVAPHWDGDGKPVPSRLSTLDEYFGLVGVLKEVNAGFIELAAGAEFNRYEREGRKNLVEIAKRSGRPVCWNVVTHRSDNPNGWREILEDMSALRQQGYRFFATSHTQPDDLEFNLKYTNVFDRWETWQRALLAPVESKVLLLRDPEVRAQMKEESQRKGTMDSLLPVMPWDRFLLVEAATQNYKRFEGMDLVQIGKALGKHPVDALLDISLEEGLQTHFRLLDWRNRDESVHARILNWPHVVAGASDGGAHLITEVNTGFPTSLLGQWVREKGIMSLEEAVRRMSALPAEEIGVTDRGKLQEGMAADVVVFDPKTVGPTQRQFVADFPSGAQRLVQYAKGINYTLVNGRVVLEEGKYTGARSGKVLRSTDYS